MSRGDRPDSAPPNIGGYEEDDEHAAATKVGEWPPEIKAHLRAEGVLPESDRLMATKSEGRPTPLPSAVDSDELTPDEVTKVYAELPAQEVVAADAPAPRPPPVPSRPPPRTVETPIAFAAISTPPSPPMRPMEHDTIDVRAFGARSKTRMLVLMIVGMAALVAFAFVMAFISQRR